MVLEQVVQRGKRIFASAVELGIRQGEFRALPVDHCVRLLLAPLIMAAIWRYSLGVCETEELDAETYLDTYLDVAIAGLSVRGA